MNYKQSTGKSIEQAFNEFDKNNPEVYKLFKKQVFRALNRGKTKISAKAIINYLRWEIDVITVSLNDDFKINDAFSPYYARKFMKENPHHEEIFETRRLRSVSL